MNQALIATDVTVNLPGGTATGDLGTLEDKHLVLLRSDGGSAEGLSTDLSDQGMHAPAGTIFVKDRPGSNKIVDSLTRAGIGTVISEMLAGSKMEPHCLIALRGAAA